MSSNYNGQCQYSPYMFGGFPTGVAQRSTSNSSFQYQQMNRSRPENVRDCMTWNTSLPSDLQGNSNYNWGGSATSYTSFNRAMQPTSITPSNRPSQAEPRAFMTVPGQGGKGDLQPISIPIQIGSSGTKINPLPAMEPIVINASKPVGGNGFAEPYQFQISAEHYMTNALGGRNSQSQY